MWKRAVTMVICLTAIVVLTATESAEAARRRRRYLPPHKKTFLPPEPAKDAKITSGPEAERKGGKVVIKFAIDKPSDVVVRILDSGGKVIRNLASGVLGENAPAPFQKDKMSQQIEWDKKDEDGNAVKPGKYTVKVDVGVKGKFDRVMASSLETVGGRLRGVNDLDTDSQGRLYVKAGIPVGYWVFPGDFLIFDRDGKFVRTILPYNPNVLPPTGVGHCPYAAKGGVAGHIQRPWLAAACGGEAVVVPGSYNNIVMIDKYGFPAGSKGCKPAMPADVDGEKNVYRVGDRFASVAKYSLREKHELKHFEYAGKEKIAEKTHVLGVPGKPGDDDKHFRKIGHVKIGSGGRIYVADQNAVKVFEKNGKYLGSVPVKDCQRIAVGHKTGALYLLIARHPGKYRSVEGEKIIKFSPWPEAKELWSFRVPKSTAALAVDESAEPHYLWVGNLKEGWAFSRISVSGGKPGEPVHFSGHGRVFTDPDEIDLDGRGNLYAIDGDSVVRMNASDGSGWKVLSKVGPIGRKGHRRTHALAIDRKNGYIYLTRFGFLRSSDRKVNGCYRFTLDGEPAPFPKRGSHHFKPQPMVRGVTTGRDGMVYLNVSDDRPFKNFPGMKFFYKAKYYEIAPDGTAKEASYAGEKPKWDHVTNASKRKGLGTCTVVSFGDEVRYRLTEWKETIEKCYIKCAHIDAYNKDGELVKKDIVLPQGATGDIAIDRSGSLYVPDAKRGPTHIGVFSPAFQDETSYLMKFAPGGGVRGGRGMVWEKHIGRAIRSDGACACSKSYLAIDEIDRIYHPDRGNCCVEILDTAGNLMAVVGGYGPRECAGPGSKYPKPDIALNAVLDVAALNDSMWISDARNRRVIKANLIYAATKSCEVDLSK